MTAVTILVEKEVPIAEDDPSLIAFTDALKTIHAAVSRQPNLAVGLRIHDVSQLRTEIGEQTNKSVSCLTRQVM